MGDTVVVVIARAVLCPSPPLLARELTGRAIVLPELRDACAAAVAHLVKADSDVVAVVGAGAGTAIWDADSRLDVASYGPSAGKTTVTPGTPGTPTLPLALGLGAMLLDSAGYAGPRLLQAVGEDEPPPSCLRLGESLDPLNPAVQSFLEQAQARFLQQTGDPAAAQQLAWQALENLRHQQAAALAYFDCFWLFAVVILAVTFVVLLMKRSVAEKGARIGGE